MPRMTVMGRWRHHSSSWGLKASCLDLTWTLGVGGSSWSLLNLGSSALRLGMGARCLSAMTLELMWPLPPPGGPTLSHSAMISAALISGLMSGSGPRSTLVSLSSLVSSLTRSKGLTLTSHILTLTPSTFSSLVSSLLPSLLWPLVLAFTPGLHRDRRILRLLELPLLLSSPLDTGLGLNLFTLELSSWNMANV